MPVQKWDAMVGAFVEGKFKCIKSLITGCFAFQDELL